MAQREKRKRGGGLREGLTRTAILLYICNRLKPVDIDTIMFDIQKKQNIKTNDPVYIALNKLYDSGILKKKQKKYGGHIWSIKPGRFIKILEFTERYGKQKEFLKTKYFRQNFNLQPFFSYLEKNRKIYLNKESKDFLNLLFSFDEIRNIVSKEDNLIQGVRNVIDIFIFLKETGFSGTFLTQNIHPLIQITNINKIKNKKDFSEYVEKILKEKYQCPEKYCSYFIIALAVEMSEKWEGEPKSIEQLESLSDLSLAMKTICNLIANPSMNHKGAEYKKLLTNFKNMHKKHPNRNK